MTDSGRETRAYVSAYDRSRVHQSRLYRFEKRRLVANFGALLGERQIRCATWSIDRPEIGVMSDPQISDDARETSVMFAAQLGGWATVRCQITLDSGEQYAQVFRINVRHASWFVDDAPLSNGPFSLRVCREDPPPPPPEPWEIVFESGRGEGVRGYANEYIGGAGRLISANTDEIAGVYSFADRFSVEMQSDSEIPEVPPFTEVQIFEGPDFSGEPRVFLAEDIVSSSTWFRFDDMKWMRYWDWDTPDENFFEGRDGDVFSCRLIRS